ncbi:MAG: hypothetical protein AAB682_02605 [Patescibacteria group bacterium]
MNIRNISLVALLSLAVSLGASSEALAETSAVNTTAGTKVAPATTLKAKIVEKKAEVKKKIETKKAEVKIKIKAVKKAKIADFGQKVLVVLNNAVARNADLITRTESRIAKFESAGRDMTDAKARIAEAKASLDSAIASLDSIEAQVKVAADAASPTSAFQKIHDLVVGAKDKIKETHAKIVDAIKAMKPASATATSTEESR